MNNSTNFTATEGRLDVQAIETRYALRVAARLTEQTHSLPHDVIERLRFARERALERARQVALRSAASVTGSAGGTLTLGGETGWWWRVASLAPVLALVAGLC